MSRELIKDTRMGVPAETCCRQGGSAKSVHTSAYFQTIQMVCYLDEVWEDYASVKLDLEIKVPSC